MSFISGLNPKIFLQSILCRNKIGAHDCFPSGEPLYTYQLTRSEYEKLINILSFYSKNIWAFDNNESLQALFVIYCSEWWRRSFQGGSWTWSDLLSEVNMTSVEENKVWIYDITEKGLAFWRRPVLRSNNGRREFLGTFAAEGGLPINQLNSPNNWIERVLKSVLDDYISFGYDLRTIIEKRFEIVNVPATFRDEKSSLKETFVKIIEAIYDLNNDKALFKQEDPVNYLNMVSPNWRERFPISLESEQGNLLLGTLIRNASQKTLLKQKNNKEYMFRLIRIAHIFENNIRFEAFIDIPKLLCLDDTLSEQIKSIESNNPNLIDIEIVFHNNQRREIIARGRLRDENKENLEYDLQILRTLSIKESKIAEGCFSLFIRLKNQQRISYPLSNAHALDFSEPMIFENSLTQNQEIYNQKIELLASSESFRYAGDSVLLFIPKILEDFIDASGTKYFLPLRSLENGNFFNFSGVLSIKADVDYLFSTGEKNSIFYYDLIGDIVECAKKPSLIFRGLPKIIKINMETGNKTFLSIKTDNIKVRALGENASWKTPNSELSGQYEITLFDSDNKNLFKRKIGLVRKDFNILLEPDNNKLQGLMTVLGVEAKLFSNSNNIDLFVIQKTTDKSKLLLKPTSDQLDEMFELKVIPNGREKSLTFECSYPALGARLYNNGQIVKERIHNIFINKLHDYRLKIFDLNNHEILIIFQLRDKALESNRNDYIIERRFKFINSKNILMTFNMIEWYEDIRKLLSHGLSIDAMVYIEVNVHHDILIKLNVKNYLSELEIDISRQHVYLRESFLKDSDSLSLEAFCLDEPEEKPILLEQRQKNGIFYPIWDTNILYKKQATWIIQSSDADLNLRPLLWSTYVFDGNDKVTEDFKFNSLKQAIKIPNSKERINAINDVLSSMSYDLSHKGWQYLHDFVVRTEGQPVEAFDLWHAVSKHSQFLASLVFQKFFHPILRQLQKALAINWYLVTFNEWSKSYQSVYEMIKDKIQLEKSDFVRELIQSELDKLVDFSFSIIDNGSLKSIKNELKKLKATPINKTVFKLVVTGEKNKMIRRCADEQFPEKLMNIVNNYIHKYKLEDIKEMFVSGLPPFKSAVIMMPIILAHRAVYESDLDLDSAQRFEIQKIIDFDLDWFEAAFDYSFGYFKNIKGI